MLRRPHRHRAVLFDLDGTLVDTAPDLVAALNQVLTSVGRPARTVAELRHEASNGTRGLLRAGLGLSPQCADFPQRQAEFLDAYRARLCEASRPFAGINELIRQMQHAGLAWGVVTNKPIALARPLLEGLKLQPQVLLGGDSSPRPKPAADALHLAAAHLRLDARQCLYVGDAERDIAAGRNAGMITICAGFGYIANEEDPATWGADHHAAQVESLWPIIANYLH